MMLTCLALSAGSHSVDSGSGVSTAGPPNPLDCLRTANYLAHGMVGGCSDLLTWEAAGGAAVGYTEGPAEWDTVTIESPDCAARIDDPDAAKWASSYSMHVRRGTADLAEVHQVPLPLPLH